MTTQTTNENAIQLFTALALTGNAALEKALESYDVLDRAEQDKVVNHLLGTKATKSMCEKLAVYDKIGDTLEHLSYKEQVQALNAYIKLSEHFTVEITKK